MPSYINKFTTLSLLSSTLLGASWMASAVVPPTTNTANSATVNVTAKVLATTCTPSWSSDTEVKLGSVSTASMGNAVGDAGLSKDFNLSLTHCDPGVTSVDVTARGTPDTDVAETYANSEATGAKFVAVKLLTGTEVLSNGKSHNFTAASNTINMPFTAKLINTKGTGVTPGAVKSKITLDIAYE
ncbi:fimbrial protein [Enterobacter sp. A103]|uniref:fimbrial protein n=1 Tax=Enterobacter sp. A103 TaxID=3102785 RepID=UPI002ACAC787|nr:fimbrial protein [Enterobacter sp. A103]MDZ5641677.1 fimbrial protein [Enterobacter sp. A103]